MAEERAAKKHAQTSIKFTDEERAEMRERSRELKAGASKADGVSAVLAKIAAMRSFYGTRDIAPRSADSPSGRTTWCSGRSLIAADTNAVREVPDLLVVDLRKFFRRLR